MTNLGAIFNELDNSQDIQRSCYFEIITANQLRKLLHPAIKSRNRLNRYEFLDDVSKENL